MSKTKSVVLWLMYFLLIAQIDNQLLNQYDLSHNLTLPSNMAQLVQLSNGNYMFTSPQDNYWRLLNGTTYSISATFNFTTESLSISSYILITSVEYITSISITMNTVYVIVTSNYTDVYFSVGNLTNVQKANFYVGTSQAVKLLVYLDQSNIYLFREGPNQNNTYLILSLTNDNFTGYIDETSYDSGLGCFSGKVYRAIVTVTGNGNHVNATITVNMIYSHNCSVNSIFYQNNKYISQDSSYTIKGMDITTSTSLTFNLGVINQSLINFIQINSTTGYFVFSNQVIVANYNAINYTYTYNVKQSLNQTVNLKTPINAQNKNIGFVEGGASLVRFTQCMGQTTFIDDTCQPYSCSITQCYDCTFSSNVCSMLCNISKCQVCANSTDCSSCIVNYVLVSGSCIMPCNVSQCLTCTSPDTCSICQSGYFLFNTSCSLSSTSISNNSCPYLYYLDSNSTCQQILGYQYLTYFGSLNSAVNSYPNLRVLLKFLSAIFSLYDDYWYYSYHNRNYSNMFITPIFLSIIRNINNQRMIPSFLSSSYLSFQVSASTQKYSQLTNYKIMEIDGSPTYFINNMSNMYIWNYALSIFTIFICRVIFLILVHVTCKKGKIFTIIIEIFSDKSSKYTIWLAFIQSNLICISYECGTQLRIPSFYSFTDKINFIVTLTFLIISIIFAMLFYVFMSNNLEINDVIREKVKMRQSYFEETFSTGLRCLFSGFVHGYFLHNYVLQMTLLILIKAIILFVCVRNRKCYVFKIGALSICSYFFIGILYDILLLYSHLFLGDNNSNIFVWAELVFISLLILASILKVVSALAYSLPCKQYVYSAEEANIFAKGFKNMIDSQNIHNSIDLAKLKIKQNEKTQQTTEKKEKYLKISPMHFLKHTKIGPLSNQKQIKSKHTRKPMKIGNLIITIKKEERQSSME